jgi:hypothetical protein
VVASSSFLGPLRMGWIWSSIESPSSGVEGGEAWIDDTKDGGGRGTGASPLERGIDSTAAGGGGGRGGAGLRVLAEDCSWSAHGCCRKDALLKYVFGRGPEYPELRFELQPASEFSSGLASEGYRLQPCPSGGIVSLRSRGNRGSVKMTSWRTWPGIRDSLR